jgi:hypothetical protein
VNIYRDLGDHVTILEYDLMVTIFSAGAYRVGIGPPPLKRH